MPFTGKSVSYFLMNTNPPFDRGYVIRVIKKVLQNFRNQGHPFIGFVAFQRQLVVAAFNLPDSGSTRVDDHINGRVQLNVRVTLGCPLADAEPIILPRLVNASNSQRHHLSKVFQGPPCS